MSWFWPYFPWRTPKLVKISVRDFAQPLTLYGSIDYLKRTGLMHRRLEGQRIHAQIQKEHLDSAIIKNKKIEVEVPLKWEWTDLGFEISGRADLIEYCENKVTIEEIKSTSALHLLADEIEKREDHPYRLQVLVYALLYFESMGVWPKARLRLVSSLDSNEILLEVKVTRQDFLRNFFWPRAEQIKEVTKTLENRKLTRLASANALTFPYLPFRKGQEELMAAVSQVVDNERSGLFQAPTGLGKTLGVLFPSLKRSLSQDKQLILITPKNSQQSVIKESIEKVASSSQVDLKAVFIQAKAKACRLPEPNCTPKVCPYARDYYEKVSRNKIHENFLRGGILTSVDFKEVSDLYEVCPFELSLEAASSADIVVGDYNYVFAPRAQIYHLLYDDKGPLKNYLVIDECHHLPDRGCDYFSAELSIGELEVFKGLVGKLPASVTSRYLGVIRRAESVIRETLGQENKPIFALPQIEEEVFLDLEIYVQRLVSKHLQILEEPIEKDPVIGLLRYITQFCDVLREGLEGSYFILGSEPKPFVKVICCDASKHLALAQAAFASVVGFSATLKPFSYYLEASGFLTEKTDTKEFPSPFDPRNRKLIVIPQISTKFKDRDNEYRRIAEVILKIKDRRYGNYMAFFPSYQFMEAVSHFILPNEPELVLQPAGANQDELSLIFELLKTKQGQLVFAVQGGSLSEGIDYIGSMLIGAFIVGPGLPHFNFEQELRRKYFDQTRGNGFEHAYVYPAMTKVIQAAGRVIRSEKDRGLIVLIDRRFLEDKFITCFPRDWYGEDVKELATQSILKDIDQFWEES